MQAYSNLIPSTKAFIYTVSIGKDVALKGRKQEIITGLQI